MSIILHGTKHFISTSTDKRDTLFNTDRGYEGQAKIADAFKESNISVNSNWVHPPGQSPGISSKNLPGGSGFDF